LIGNTADSAGSLQTRSLIRFSPISTLSESGANREILRNTLYLSVGYAIRRCMDMCRKPASAEEMGRKILGKPKIVRPRVTRKLNVDDTKRDAA
jgi:hypothetical protein